MQPPKLYKQHEPRQKNRKKDRKKEIVKNRMNRNGYLMIMQNNIRLKNAKLNYAKRKPGNKKNGKSKYYVYSEGK